MNPNDDYVDPKRLHKDSDVHYKRERNRLAQRRSREKKEKELLTLRQNNEELEKVNLELGVSIVRKKEELSYLQEVSGSLVEYNKDLKDVSKE